MANKTLNTNNGTLDAFLQRRMAETPATDWQRDDAGGIFAILFSESDEFTEAEAENIFQKAVTYYRNEIVDQLAEAFREAILAEAGPIKAAEIDRRNKEPQYANCCASHDFCDANMPMAEAFEATIGRAPNPSNEDDAAIWNAAWDKAKTAGFEDKTDWMGIHHGRNE